MSLPEASSCLKKLSTPFVLVKARISKFARELKSAKEIPAFAGMTSLVSIIGVSMTSAPRAVRRAEIPLACLAARVTTRRLPESGKFFFQARDLPSSTTPPMIVIAGAVTFSRMMVSPAVSSVAVTVRWYGVVPFSIKARGVFGSLPHSIRRLAIKSMLAIPIRKMSVPGHLASVSKSRERLTSLSSLVCSELASVLSSNFSCPVMIWKLVAMPR